MAGEVAQLATGVMFTDAVSGIIVPVLFRCSTFSTAGSRGHAAVHRHIARDHPTDAVHSYRAHKA
jgi:hypothetical protein